MLIKKVEVIPFAGFEELKEESEREGFRFLKRLQKEWKKGENQFSAKGEALYKVLIKDELVGIGGINRNPFDPDPCKGRLRRFYIKPSWRRKGVGKALVYYILSHAQHQFEEVHLRTDNEQAVKFYEQIGFERVDDNDLISHRKKPGG